MLKKKKVVEEENLKLNSETLGKHITIDFLFLLRFVVCYDLKI